MPLDGSTNWAVSKVSLKHSRHLKTLNSNCEACVEEFRQAVMLWSESGEKMFPWRREGRTSYELVVAEVLLQQTRAEQVASLFPRILQRCSGWVDLATIPIGELKDLLKPLGLQNRRASTLHALACRVKQEGLPDTAAGLQELPGIGQYMARAIAAQLFGEVVAPVDTNVARVLERVFGPRTLADIRYDPALQGLALELVPASDPGGYLVGILDFASTVCRPRSPRCGECPVASCGFRSNDRQF